MVSVPLCSNIPQPPSFFTIIFVFNKSMFLIIQFLVLIPAILFFRIIISSVFVENMSYQLICPFLAAVVCAFCNHASKWCEKFNIEQKPGLF